MVPSRRSIFGIALIIALLSGSIILQYQLKSLDHERFVSKLLFLDLAVPPPPPALDAIVAFEGLHSRLFFDSMPGSKPFKDELGAIVRVAYNQPLSRETVCDNVLVIFVNSDQLIHNFLLTMSERQFGRSIRYNARAFPSHRVVYFDVRPFLHGDIGADMLREVLPTLGHRFGPGAYDLENRERLLSRMLGHELAHLTTYTAVPQTSEKAVALYNKGLAADQRRELTEAQGHYREALEYAPCFLEVLVNLGLVLAKSGQPELALGFYERSLRLAPAGQNARQNIGHAYLLLGELDKAARAFEILVQLRPKEPEGYLGLGVVARAAGRMEEAVRHFQLAEELYLEAADPLVLDTQVVIWKLANHMHDGGLAKRYKQRMLESCAEHKEKLVERCSSLFGDVPPSRRSLKL